MFGIGMRQRPPVKASTTVRAVLGTATIVSLGIALVARTEPRWYAISGACGVLWWAWDLIVEYIIEPLGAWLTAVLMGGALDEPTPGARPSLDDTVRLLESHLERGASRKVDINAAIRLEEIYRVVKKKPEEARRVVDIVLERHPDAPELKRFQTHPDGSVEEGPSAQRGPEPG
jgi:hypothetical protein